MKTQQFARRVAVALLIVGMCAIASCSSNTELKPFSSDGCSLFPDSSVITGDDWCTCCFEHDLAYWRGGTELERELSDARLRDCVLEKTNDKALAQIMYEGVKMGGSPYFYNWYRWGYGWSYDRKYQELTRSEIARADQLKKDYFQSGGTGVCDVKPLPAATL